MNNNSFVDFYELLEIDFDATDEVIEQRFRQFANEPHPDSANSEQVEKFAVTMEAFETLSDPELRTAYNEVFENEKQGQLDLFDESDCIETDCAQRHRLLSLFYAKRRQSMESPGIGNSTLQELAKIPSHVLDFHIWYMTEKNWIKREESGMLAITAFGVDKIETSVEYQVLENPVATDIALVDEDSTQASADELNSVGSVI